MLVHQILRAKSDDEVVTVAPDLTVAQAAEIMADRRIGAVIVSADGATPLGILSERDIVREIGRRGATCMSELVETMMTKKLVGCARNDSADHVLATMTEGRFRHLPVLDDGKMVGLISIGDVVKARLSELSMERDALQDMVMGH